MASTLLEPSEALRIALLEEEQRLRGKQPKAWTKVKYRKYANFGKAKTKEL